jgi:hypothetical protein
MVLKTRREKGMKYVLVFTILCLLLMVVGCGEKLESGEVYEREFREAYTQMVIIPMIVSTGNSTTTMMIPYFFHYPDRWVIKIRQWDYTKGEYITATYFVTEEVYDNHDIGDYYNFDPKTATKEEPVVKEKQS